jgi:hypothetical protein
MNCRPTTTKEMENIFKTLKSKNSQGYDEITTKILKVSFPFISSPLIYICNKSVSSGIFPHRLKYWIIKSLYRKGNKHEVFNYRPVLLLTSISKIFEK